MTKKSTATKSAATRSTATKTARKSSAARTKLPDTTPVIIEAVAPPAEVVESVAPAAEAAPAVVEATVEAVAAAEPEKIEAPEIIEAMAPPTRTLTHDEYAAMVRKEAYLLASARGFRNGTPFEDWVRAEAVVRARLTAEGASFPAA